MAPSLLQSQSPILLNVAGTFTLMPFVMGLIGTFSPSTMLKSFGFDRISDAETRRTATNLMLFHSSRDMFMAAVNFAAWYRGDRTMLGIISFAGCGVAAYDGYLSQKQIGKDSWKHTGWIPIVATMGAALLGWFD